MSSKYVKWLGVLFVLFHIYNNWFTAVSELWFAAIHFSGFGALCALRFHLREDATPGHLIERAFGVLLALLAVSVAVYLVFFENALYARETEFVLADYLFSGLAVLLAMEFARRTSGWFMPALIALSFAYILFLGRYVPGVFSFPGLSLETVLYRSFYSAEGMFGMVANISSTFVFMFILFGAFLLKSGAGDFIVRLARSLAGRYQGGAGHVAIVSSGLMGSVSGSAVATTVSTGVITIPMMTRYGFRPRFAAGVEAAASTGGQLMPPVMGAGAFVMSSYTQIPYLQIIAVSVLPALLYFLTVAFFVRIEARRLNLTLTTDDNEPSTVEALKSGWHFIIPLAVLVISLVAGYTPVRSATFAIFAIVGVSWFTDTPMNLSRCIDASLDALRAYGATHVRIPVGYWIMDAPVGGSDPYEFGFQAEGFVTGGLNYLEAMLLRLKRRGLRAMIDLHALPGCASACQAYAGVMCRTPTFWRARPCLAPRGRTSILQRLLRRLSVPRRAVRCAGARRLKRACCAAMEARMRRWPARRAAQAQASCG